MEWSDGYKGTYPKDYFKEKKDWEGAENSYMNDWV